MAKCSKAGTNPSSKEKAPVKKGSPARAYRKKNAFSPENKYKKKLTGGQYNEIRVITTKGDVEIYMLLKGGTNGRVDAYGLHLKKDIEEDVEYTVQLCLSGAWPRRVSRDNNLVAFIVRR
eukprot:scaffold51340_cov62-Attheya_sp.AAC.5